MLKVGIKKLATSIAVIGLLIFLHFIGILRPVENIIIGILNPIFSGFYSVSSNVRIKYNEQTSKADLLKKIERLESQNSRLIEGNTKLKIAEEENKILREHLKFLTKNKCRFVISNVISRGDIMDISGCTETMIINKGTKDGIYAGLGVVSSQGTIVGKIIEAKDNISKVYLINNSKCKLAATVLNQEKTSGITEGKLGLTIKMGFISHDNGIKINDIVVTSGLEQLIPRGLVIGKVMEVNKESNKIWQSAVIEPLADLDGLIIVSVLLP